MVVSSVAVAVARRWQVVCALLGGWRLLSETDQDLVVKSSKLFVSWRSGLRVGSSSGHGCRWSPRVLDEKSRDGSTLELDAGQVEAVSGCERDGRKRAATPSLFRPAVTPRASIPPSGPPQRLNAARTRRANLRRRQVVWSRVQARWIVTKSSMNDCQRVPRRP